MEKKANWRAMLLTLVISMLAVSWSAGALGEGAVQGDKKPTTIELMQALTRAIMDMSTRDRSSDTHIYQIDSERFVSEQDVQALMNVLQARKALQKAQGFNEDIIEPDEDFARELLFEELLLRAEANALGIEDLDKSVMWYIKEGWLEPEPPAPDASDTEALIRQGWIRLQLLESDLRSAQNTKRPYEDSAALIEDLINTLKLRYTASAQ